jgi:hypothetical protein
LAPALGLTQAKKKKKKKKKNQNKICYFIQKNPDPSSFFLQIFFSFMRQKNWETFGSFFFFLV